MLTAQDVSFRVGGRALLDGISAAFAPGELSLIIGPNGAGKSTLIKSLCRRQTGASGIVRYEGRPLHEWPERSLARVRAVLSQNIEVAFPLEVWEVVMMGRYPHFVGEPGRRDVQACEEAMRFFDVDGMAERNYLTLSGGERQRVQFARVLAQIWYPTPGASRYLLLDEPLTFLDIRYQVDFMRRVRELLGDGDLVAVGVVHDLNLAARFADRLMLLAGGRVLAAGAPGDVLVPALVHEAFAIEPVIGTDEATGRRYLYFQ